MKKKISFFILFSIYLVFLFGCSSKKENIQTRSIDETYTSTKISRCYDICLKKYEMKREFCQNLTSNIQNEIEKLRALKNCLYTSGFTKGEATCNNCEYDYNFYKNLN